MTSSNATSTPAQTKSSLLPIAAGVLLLAATACNGSSAQKGGNNAVGSIVTKPDGGAIIVDSNNLGLATEVRIVSAAWGRLVDVFGLDGSGERVPMQEDFLIGPSLTSTAGSYSLETSSVTGSESLIILRDVTDTSVGGGLQEFFGLLRTAEANLAPLSDQGLNSAGTFTMVPRNATVVLRFDDLLDPNLISRTTIRSRTGSPPTNTYDSRVFADPNHGDLIEENGVMRFYPTRAYVDPTITAIEAASDDQGLGINTSGYPASLNANLANISIEIPTIENFQIGQSVVLMNRSGHELSTNLNGSIDSNQDTLPVVRYFRSGGSQNTTGDPFNGFLPDTTAPQVIGSQGGFITSRPTQSMMDAEDEFTIPTYQFGTPECSQTPVTGDVLSQPGIFAEVIEDAQPPDLSGLVLNLRVRLLAFPAGFASPVDWLDTAIGSATFLSAFDPVADSGRQGCFVTVTPSATTAPTTGIGTDSSFAVLFNEPMDRGSFSAFDSLLLTRTAGTSNSDLVVGTVQSTADLLRYTFFPTLPLAHAAGMSETYTLQLDPDTDNRPPTDLAGNRLQTPLPPVPYTITAGQNVEHNSSRVLRFSGVDEEAPIGNVSIGESPMPEFSGQHFYDTARGTIRPRAVTRFEAVADRTQPVAALAVPAGQGSSTPLSSNGSKLQAFWRPLDFGMSYDDPTRYNLDVEGINWAPYQDLVSTDRFEQFEIRLAHGRFSPDEYICPGPPAVAIFPNTGVVGRFQDNLLSLLEDPLKVVHPRFQGFSISPGQIFASATGTRLVPYPLNQNIPAKDYKYYTWRDTGIQARGGAAGSVISSIVPPFMFQVAVGTPFMGCIPTAFTPATTVLWMEENVQSVGLPLLMEFRCFPDNGAASINRLDTTVTQNINFKPFFRAHSTGGVGANGVEEVDPDMETVASGGFNPSSLPANQATAGTDRTTYVGSLDLVVRISRSYSIWWLADEAGASTASFPNPKYNKPTIEPPEDEQPDGTSVSVAMRGAIAISNVGGGNLAPERRTALILDAYGDVYGSEDHSMNPNSRVSPFNGDATWKVAQNVGTNPTGIDGAQFYQVRITFQSNPVSGLVPSVSALGITWEE